MIILKWTPKTLICFTDLQLSNKYFLVIILIYILIGSDWQYFDHLVCLFNNLTFITYLFNVYTVDYAFINLIFKYYYEFNYKLIKI